MFFLTDPYRMVIINIIVSLLLVLGVLFYIYVYPKKKVNLFVFLILITLLPLLSLLRPGDYESGDFNIHIRRAIDFYQSLSEGHFIPSWAGGLNFSYGYPLYIFNYTFVYYIIALLHFIGFSFISSMKIFLATNFMLTGIFMYLFANKIFKNSRAAFVAAIFYQFTPYHLIDLHFRATIGELMIFMFLPLTFFLLHQFWEKKTRIYFVLFVLATSLLIINHIALAVFVLALMICYTLFYSYSLKRWRIFILTVIGIVISLISSIYTWAAPFILSQYTIVTKMSFTPSFPQLWEFIYSSWKFGFLFQGHQGQIASVIGYSHLLIICILFFMILSKKINKKYKNFVYFWFASFFLFFFLMTSFSNFLWTNLPFLKTIVGGSSRLLLFTGFTSSILAGYVSLNTIKKQTIFWLIIICTIFSTILNWGQRRVIPEITDQQLIQSIWTEGDHFYANSKWIDTSLLKKPPKYHILLSNSESKIQEVQRTSTTHSYVISTETPITIKENTMYFPGWQAYDNNNPILTKPDKDGLLSFIIPKGLHYVEVEYTDIPLYKKIKIISISGLFFTFSIGFFLLQKVYKTE